MSAISDAVQERMDDYLKNGTPFPVGWGTRSYNFYQNEDFVETFIHMIQWINEDLIERKAPFHIDIPVSINNPFQGSHPVQYAAATFRAMNDYYKEESIPAEFIAIEEEIDRNQVVFSFRWEDKEY